MKLALKTALWWTSVLKKNWGVSTILGLGVRMTNLQVSTGSRGALARHVEPTTWQKSLHRLAMKKGAPGCLGCSYPVMWG